MKNIHLYIFFFFNPARALLVFFFLVNLTRIHTIPWDMDNLSIDQTDYIVIELYQKFHIINGI